MLGGVIWLGGATALAVRLAFLTRYEHSEEDFTMPIYEYVCQDCSHEMEALQKISDDALKDCPACAKPALKKKISAAGFRLKRTSKPRAKRILPERVAALAAATVQAPAQHPQRPDEAASHF